MSIKIMSAIWSDGPADKAEILILLALADFCNDDGECWPSVATIAQKARMTERGAQKIMARLVETGWLEIHQNAARRNCNLYRVITPERGSPRTPFTPNADAEPPNTVPKTPEPGSPKPSLTINEASVIEDARDVRHILRHSASDEAITSFIAYRRKQRGKSLTATAAKRLAAQLREIFANGGDTDDALGMAEERGWLTVQADWYFNAKGKAHGKRDNGQRYVSEGRQNRADPALENILRLAGLGKASGDDCP